MGVGGVSSVESGVGGGGGGGWRRFVFIICQHGIGSITVRTNQ